MIFSSGYTPNKILLFDCVLPEFFIIFLNRFMKRYLLLCCCLILCFSEVLAAKRVSNTTRQKMQRELPIFDLTVGDEVLIRTFKKESRLELWMRAADTPTFKLFKTYPICYYSGGLGPKRYQGDKVTPEGFYGITKKRLNPYSRFHLSMNIGYPNAYDRQLSRTGSLLMIHGACDAVGCFAMSNGQIEEIYYLVEQALHNGQQKVEVHAFPFHLSDENLNHYKDNKWYGFWQQLQIGYQWFNHHNIPPRIEAVNGRYVFSPSSASPAL